MFVDIKDKILEDMVEISTAVGRLLQVCKRSKINTSVIANITIRMLIKRSGMD